MHNSFLSFAAIQVFFHTLLFFSWWRSPYFLSWCFPFVPCKILVPVVWLCWLLSWLSWGMCPSADSPAAWNWSHERFLRYVEVGGEKATHPDNSIKPFKRVRTLISIIFHLYVATNKSINPQKLWCKPRRRLCCISSLSPPLALSLRYFQHLSASSVAFFFTRRNRSLWPAVVWICTVALGERVPRRDEEKCTKVGARLLLFKCFFSFSVQISYSKCAPSEAWWSGSQSSGKLVRSMAEHWATSVDDIIDECLVRLVLNQVLVHLCVYYRNIHWSM